MKKVLAILIFILSTINAYSFTLKIELTTKDDDDLWASTIVVRNSEGELISRKRFSEDKIYLEVPDTIADYFKIRIDADGFFPVELDGLNCSKLDTMTITDVLLVWSLRKKLPRNATCGTFAPRKKDIPKKITISINGRPEDIVPDKMDVVALTYIRNRQR